MEGDWFPRQQAFPIRPRRRRGRAYRAGGTLVRASGGASSSRCDYLKDGTDGFRIESGTACRNNFQKEESSTSSDKTSTNPREKPMVKEISREEEIRWYSSSVIAKLMDLDGQPPVQLVSKQKRAAIGSFQELSAVGFQESYITRNKPLFRMSTADHHQFKDASKIMQKLDKKNPYTKALPNLRPYKGKMNKQRKTKTGEVCSQLESNKSRFTYTKNYLSSFRIPTTDKDSLSHKGHSDSFLHQLALIHTASKNYRSIHPNHILVSKLTASKTRSKGQGVHLTVPENIQFAHRRWTIQTVTQKAQIGGRDRLHISHNMEISGCRTRGPRDISREVTEVLRESASDSKKRLSVLGFSRCHIDGISCAMSGMNNVCNSRAFRRSSDHIDKWNSNYGSALSSSSESMRSEARNHFSGKWKASGYSKEAGGKNSSTLPELLFLSDKETQSKSYHSPTFDNVTDEKFTRTGMRVSWGGSHSTISSKRSWEDGFFKNLSKSTSVPATTTIYGSQDISSLHQFGDAHYCTFNDVMKLRPKKLNLRVSSSFSSVKNRNENFYSNLGGEEDVLHMKEIHITREKQGKGELVKRSAEWNFKLFSVCNYVDVDMLLRTYKEQTHLLKNPKASRTNPKEASPDHLQVDYEVLNPVPREEASQPCNVSMLELPLRQGDSGSSGSPSGNLLENHINYLTSEFVNPCAKLLGVPTLSNEIGRQECDCLPQSGYLEEEFMDEEERDYTYLLDMLIISGVHSCKRDKIHDAIYSQEYPMNPTLFDKLEKKYDKLIAWSPSERKLMFDLTNSILVEILRPCMDQHPWINSTRRIGPMWGSEGLIEKTWQMLVRQRMELNFGNAEDKVLDFKWLDLGDSIKAIGKEIEMLLKEELLEDLVTEFL